MMALSKIIMFYKVYNIYKSRISDNKSTKYRRGEMNIKGSSTKEMVLLNITKR